MRDQNTMKITRVDASNYFRGLLLLIRKDGKVTDKEKELTRHIGKSLGFEREFCDNAIHEILENKFIVDVPPVFSTRELAMKFVKDGLTLASSENEVRAPEEEWLKSTATKNGLSAEWFAQERQKTVRTKGIDVHLEVDHLVVEHASPNPHPSRKPQ
jgi:hypothetical protein